MSALGFLSKASAKFFLEVGPVALASVMGTVLVNHYSHSSAPIVVQPSRPPDAMVQALHDEHQLIIDLLKRDAAAGQAVNDEEGAGRPAPAAPAVLAAKDGPAKPRVASRERAAPRPRPKAERAQDPLPLGPDLASLPAPDSSRPPVGLVAEGSNMAGAIGVVVAAAWQYPGRALQKLSLADLPAASWPVSWAEGVLQSHGEATARH